MKLVAAFVLLCGCKPLSSPTQPIAPLPPEASAGEGSAQPQVAEEEQPVAPAGPVEFQAFPVIDPMPVSKPTGKPITFPAPVAKVGEAYRYILTSTFEQHYRHDNLTRYQLTKQDFDLGIKVLGVEANHASRIQVDTTRANEWIALASAPTTRPTQNIPLLQGSYTVAGGTGKPSLGHDVTQVLRDGAEVHGREQEELGELFGEELRDGDPLLVFLGTRKLRVGEHVALGDADKKEIVGSDPLPGPFVIGILAADAQTITYRLDAELAGEGGDLAAGKVELRLQSTIVLERSTGRVLERRDLSHKLSSNVNSVDDTYSTRSMVIKR